MHRAPQNRVTQSLLTYNNRPSTSRMAPSSDFIYASSSSPTLSPTYTFKRKKSYLMPSNATEHALPLHSTSKHVSISPSRRKLKIVAFILISLALVVFVLSFHFLPAYFEKLPLSSPLRFQINRPSETYGPDPVYSPDPLHPLSSLGPEADRAYKLGSLSQNYYPHTLKSFIDEVFPSSLKSRLKSQFDKYLNESSTSLPERRKIIWQTYEFFPDSADVHSWKSENQDYDYHFLNDEDVDDWIKLTFKGSRIERLWNTLPHVILKADLLRYLLLYVEGGVYSDVDTLCLRPIDMWGQFPNTIGQLNGHDSPAAILGVEADVGDREDWHSWWSRPLQIVQWTMVFSPGHPILLDAIERIYRKTMELETSSNGLMASMPEKDLLPLVLEWTGPAVFTDSTLRFLLIQSNIQWIDLRQLEKPLRVGSITILPVTGFSPGVGNFNAKSPSDQQAMVQHKFKGSWKPQESN